MGEAVTLPHTWNAVDGQDGGNDYYRGTCWYTLALAKPAIPAGGKAVLQLDGAAMTAAVYLNGEKLAEHKGGYSAFQVDLTDHLKEENLLAISVDNRDNDTVYPQKADFTFYGGIYRDVTLHVVPAEHFALPANGAPALKVTPIVTDLAAKTAEVTVEAAVVGAQSVAFALEGQSITAPVENGTAKAVFTLDNAHLWDGVDDSFLYTVSAKLDNGEETSARFGCRKFEFDPQKGFLLNGRSYPLRGVSRHQDRKGAGIALTNEMMEEDISIILEMGANTIRLAHYQHAQYFYDLCDEKGLVIWAEIPYITMHMTNGRANTLTQMEELIVQNYNHPCIAVWGLSNEITAASAVNEDLLENHRLLNELAHKLDPTRKTTMANVFMLETTSPILEIPDVNSYNLYFGWYLGELEQNDEFFDKYHADYPDRCIGFSEYGADANPQYQSSHPEKGDYTESYQCVYHEHIAKMIADRPWLWATHVWNMFDFAADGRDEGGKHGENQKGLVTFDRKLKKDPFYLYKAYWSKEPFVHLCGSRYVDRAEDVTETKVAGMPVGKGGNLDWHKLVQEAGLQVISLHTDLGSLERDAHAVAEEAKSFGTQYVVITGMYRFDYGDEAAMHQLAQRLNKAGEALAAEGIHLLYHNHNCELRHVNAETRAYDILIEETNPEFVNFEFDSYWFTEGGANALAWMQRLGSRMKLWHINDRGTRLSGSAITPILKTDSMELGTGNMDLDSLMAQALAVDVDAVILESHRNWVDNSPVKSFQLSAKYLAQKF